MLTDPLAPQPMTPAEVADIVERAREATQRAKERSIAVLARRWLA